MRRFAKQGADERHGPAITCSICAAHYLVVTSESHKQGQHSLLACETLLLEVSRFCFRCRRPACPDCWNEIYEICAACVQETQPSLLSGATHLQIGQVEEKVVDKGRLVCTQVGRYHHQPSPNQTIVHRSGQDAPRSPSGSTSGRLSQQNVAQFQERTTQPPVHQSITQTQHLKRQEQPHRGEIALDELETIPVPAVKHGDKRQRSQWRIFIPLILCLLLIGGSIVAAFLSVEVNTYISQLLHIDVRGWAAALWKWLQQFHFSD